MTLSIPEKEIALKAFQIGKSQKTKEIRINEEIGLLLLECHHLESRLIFSLLSTMVIIFYAQGIREKTQTIKQVQDFAHTLLKTKQVIRPSSQKGIDTILRTTQIL